MGGLGFGVGERGDGRVPAQFVQAAAAGGADAADRDAEPGADLGVRQGRVGGQQGDQPLAVRGEDRSNASRSAACRSAASSSCSAVAACSSGRVLGVQVVPGGQRSCGRRAAPGQHSRRVVVASQPGSAAGLRRLPRWSTRCSQTFGLTSAASALAKPVLAADGPDQRGVPLDQRIPRLLVADLLARATRPVTGCSLLMAMVSFGRMRWPAQWRCQGFGLGRTIRECRARRPARGGPVLCRACRELAPWSAWIRRLVLRTGLWGMSGHGRCRAGRGLGYPVGGDAGR